jgi:hypothetical protein
LSIIAEVFIQKRQSDLPFFMDGPWLHWRDILADLLELLPMPLALLLH